METITVQARIAGDLHTIWNYYTDPDHIVGWNFAHESWCCPEAENDLRPGGKYRARMEARDGSAGFDYEATYTEVVPRTLLRSVMPDGRNVQTTFESEDGHTLVTTSFDPEGLHPLSMQRDGWQAILDQFKAYVERNSQG